jgi:hypothetical protein
VPSTLKRLDRGGVISIPLIVAFSDRPRKFAHPQFRIWGVAKFARQTPPCLDLVTIPVGSPQPLVSTLVRASVAASSFSVTIRNTLLAVRKKASGFLIGRRTSFGGMSL